MTRAKAQLTAKEILVVNNGEDEVSYKRHINAMKMESRKVKSNEAVITELMGLTYKQRRMEIEGTGSHVQEILDKFPTMGNYEQVCV